MKNIETSWVEYASVDGKTVKGYLAQPKQADADIPGIIAIHEWWGLNKITIADVLRLTNQGYRVLAPDLYYGKVTHDPDESQKLMQSVIDHPELAKDNLKQAYQYLVDRGSSKIGVIGWCFGGSWSLQTALLFPKKLSAAVIYYGTQVGQMETKDLEPLSMPILGFFGAEDKIIPVENVRKFKSNLDKLGKKARIQIYEGIGHAFADPTDDRFEPEITATAWSETEEFLAQNLQS